MFKGEQMERFQMKIKVNNRELLALSILSILAIIFIIFLVSINFVEGLSSFFYAHVNYSNQFINKVILLYLAVLFLLIYQRWRKAETKQAEFEDIISSVSPDVLMVVDQNKNIVMCNPSVEKMFGYTLDEVTKQKTVFLCFHGVIFERDGFNIGFATGKKKDGETIPLEVITGHLSNKAGSVLLLRDITERKQAEDLLLASEANLRNIIEKNADGIIVVNKNGVVRFVNPAAEALFGRKTETLLGQFFGFPVVAGETAEIDILRDGGEIKIAEMNVVETTWEGEKAYLASLRDVTEHKRILKELEQTRQEQLRLKDEFLSHVSHELRSPLTAIHQFVTILLDGLAGDLNPEQREYMEIAIKNVNQLQTMISDMLEITRAETGKLIVEPQCISIAKVVTETFNTLQKSAAARGIVLSTDITSDIPLIYADPSRVQQILINLLDNGLKFTPENGIITVRAQIYDQDPNILCVSVADTGCGISAEDTERIFDRLYQKESTISGSRKGLGLGLYICKELASRHGGRIWVESQLGHGSTFFFTLPIFSLTRLIAPLFTTKNLLRSSIALFTIELFPGAKSVLKEINKLMLREVRNILQSCILPDLDILLPEMPYQKKAIFFIVAFADHGGAKVLMQRIQSQLSLCKDFQNASLNHEVSFTIFSIPSKGDNIPLEHLTKYVVEKIEGMIRNVTETSGIMT